MLMWFFHLGTVCFPNFLIKIQTLKNHEGRLLSHDQVEFTQILKSLRETQDNNLIIAHVNHLFENSYYFVENSVNN